MGMFGNVWGKFPKFFKKNSKKNSKKPKASLPKKWSANGVCPGRMGPYDASYTPDVLGPGAPMHPTVHV